MRLRRHIWSGLAGAALMLTPATAEKTRAQLARDLGLVPTDTSAAAVRLPVLPTEGSFALSQLRHDRVLEARIATRHQIKRMFQERGLRYPAAEMFLRIFKRERTLELWVRPEGSERFELLKAYGICALAGELGPKRRLGDNQVPEGFYAIDFFNPQSEYHLSLHVDYPNVRDRMAGLEGVRLGGDIYIHGGCNSAGCLALTDEGIMELYWMAVEARAVGQQTIPVHIFPARLGDEDLRLLHNAFAGDPALPAFWTTLKPGYDFFEQNRRIPLIAVNDEGTYVLRGAAPNASAPVTSLSGLVRPARAAAKPSRPAPLGAPIGN